MNVLTVLDPCLNTATSHNFTQALALRREADHLNLRLDLKCLATADLMVSGIPAEPFFRQSGYAYMADERPAADFVTIHFCNQSTLEDLRRLTPGLGGDDVVLFPTVTCNLVLGICRWLQEFARGREPRVVLCLMFPPDLNTAGRPSAIARRTYQEAFALLPDRFARRLVFTCETGALAEAYQPLLGTRPVVSPLRTWSLAEPKPGPDARVTRLSYLGGAREEKGFHLLPDLIDIILARFPDLRFTVQAVGHQPELLARVTGRLTQRRDSVTLLREPLSDQAFFGLLRDTSLLLLPYDAEAYRQRGSSLFTEARAMGLPMVLPDGSAFAGEARHKGLAECFARQSAEDVAQAVFRAIGRHAELAMAAMREAAAYRRFDAGYVAMLLDCLARGER